jgi:hypothetical protein
LTDLLAEGINAVIETQDSYAKDWTEQVHGEAWARSRSAESGESRGNL